LFLQILRNAYANGRFSAIALRVTGRQSPPSPTILQLSCFVVALFWTLFEPRKHLICLPSTKQEEDVLTDAILVLCPGALWIVSLFISISLVEKCFLAKGGNIAGELINKKLQKDGTRNISFKTKQYLREIRL